MSQLLDDMSCISMSARVGATYGKPQREAEYRVIDYVRTLEARVAEIEAEAVQRKLPKVWEMKIAGREIVIRVENGRMSAVATLVGDDTLESFTLNCVGAGRVDGWPEHPEPDQSGEGG